MKAVLPLFNHLDVESVCIKPLQKKYLYVESVVHYTKRMTNFELRKQIYNIFVCIILLFANKLFIDMYW